MFKIIALTLLICLSQYVCPSKSHAVNGSNILPVVLWHGMGDTCCFAFSLGTIRDTLKELLGPETYIKSIRIGDNLVEDYESGYFVHPNKQVEAVCKQVAEDENLKNGYNAIGFSQGAQFIRAVAQRCPSPRINNLISLGGQHQGVFGIPSCPSLSHESCERIRLLLNTIAYTKLMQNYLVQATYWHNPWKENEYKKYSSFLADINNEHTINTTYIKNLKQLNKFVLVKFTEDTIVQPIDTEWFEFYEPNQDKKILPLARSAVADNLGLNDLIALNKMHFLETKGNHLQFTTAWFVSNILPYLNGTI